SGDKQSHKKEDDDQPDHCKNFWKIHTDSLSIIRYEGVRYAGILPLRSPPGSIIQGTDRSDQFLTLGIRRVDFFSNRICLHPAGRVGLEQVRDLIAAEHSW